MSRQSSKTSESEDETRDARSRAMDATASITQRGKDGSLAVLTGSVLLVRAVRSRRSRGRAVVQALAGTALVAFGLRQRRSGDDRFPSDDAGTAGRNGTGTVEQRAESQQHDVNPRGTSGEPDVETTASDEGSVQFTEDQDERMGSEPHLDPSPEDPRLDGEADEPTEVDLSEASMADEASEATGPTPEQSQPTQTEETEPERTPPEDSTTADANDEPDDENETT